MNRMKNMISTSTLVLSTVTMTTALADNAEALTKKLPTLIVAMISKPFQILYKRNTMNLYKKTLCLVGLGLCRGVPINVMVSKVMKFGTQLVSLQGGVRYWAVTDSDMSPEGWGARLSLTFIFPK